MEKRLILAIALSVLIIVSFQYIFPAPKHAPIAGKAQESAAVKEAENIQYLPPIPPVDEKEYTISTDRFIITFSNIGGAVKKIELKNYKKLKSSEPI